MTAVTMKHFDTLSFVKRSKELGANEQLAEYQARQIEEAIDIAVTTSRQDIENKELVTKGDLALTNAELKQVELRLQKEIAVAKNQIIIWVAAIMMGSGLITHYFK